MRFDYVNFKVYQQKKTEQQKRYSHFEKYD